LASLQISIIRRNSTNVNAFQPKSTPRTLDWNVPHPRSQQPLQFSMLWSAPPEHQHETSPQAHMLTTEKPADGPSGITDGLQDGICLVRNDGVWDLAKCCQFKLLTALRVHVRGSHLAAMIARAPLFIVRCLGCGKSLASQSVLGSINTAVWLLVV